MKDLFDSFNGKKIMIVGDMMLDIYMKGKVERISPEAPVPIVAVTETFSRLGGAANVAQNLKTLGAEPILCSIVGNDEKANELLDLELPESDEYQTIGGLILHHHQSIPKAHEIITLDKFQFRMIKVTATQIELVKLKVSE